MCLMPYVPLPVKFMPEATLASEKLRASLKSRSVIWPQENAMTITELKFDIACCNEVYYAYKAMMLIQLWPRNLVQDLPYLTSDYTNNAVFGKNEPYFFCSLRHAAYERKYRKKVRRKHWKKVPQLDIDSWDFFHRKRKSTGSKGNLNIVPPRLVTLIARFPPYEREERECQRKHCWKEFHRC